MKTIVRTLNIMALLALVTCVGQAERLPNVTPPATQQAHQLQQTQQSFNHLLSTHQLHGTASYYGKKFHNKRTANGEVFDMNALTAAHRTLPFGTVVEVTNQTNNKSVRVRINDRGPFVKNRVIDLSKYAASVVGMINSGTAPVRLRVLQVGKGRSNDPRSNGASSIQVASYSKRQRAEEVVQYLSAHGLNARLETSHEFYRVVIADLQNAAQLSSAQGTLSMLGFENVLVRRVLQ